MINKASINRISNKNILKLLFSFLKYKQILKLVRNNKGLKKDQILISIIIKKYLNFQNMNISTLQKLLEKGRIEED